MPLFHFDLINYYVITVIRKINCLSIVDVSEDLYGLWISVWTSYFVAHCKPPNLSICLSIYVNTCCLTHMYIVQYVHVLMVLMFYRCALSRITAVPCLNVLQVCIVSVYYRCGLCIVSFVLQVCLSCWKRSRICHCMFRTDWKMYPSN